MKRWYKYVSTGYSNISPHSTTEEMVQYIFTIYPNILHHSEQKCHHRKRDLTQVLQSSINCCHWRDLLHEWQAIWHWKLNALHPLQQPKKINWLKIKTSRWKEATIGCRWCHECGRELNWKEHYINKYTIQDNIWSRYHNEAFVLFGSLHHVMQFKNHKC